MLMKKALEYVGIIEKPGTLIELNMGLGEAECEVCKIDLTSTSKDTELHLK